MLVSNYPGSKEAAVGLRHMVHRQTVPTTPREEGNGAFLRARKELDMENAESCVQSYKYVPGHGSTNWCHAMLLGCVRCWASATVSCLSHESSILSPDRPV